MADRNNLPRFEEMFKFEGEMLYRTIDELQEQIDALQERVQELENGRGN